MSLHYTGPLREEPVSIELHNTLYATPGGPVDGLDDDASLAAFLGAVAPRLGIGLSVTEIPDADRLLEVRRVTRAALKATIEHERHDLEVIEALNRFAAQALTSLRAERAAHKDTFLRAAIDYHGATRQDIICAAFATDAIELITGPRRGELRACGAPGCVLVYLKNDPRQRWCSSNCGNRARQARHYQRSRGAL
jgi:predicted RNA-binding Zn ribbon-like protein